MANHGFVTIKGGSFSKDKVYEALQEILKRRFKGKLVIDGSLEDSWWEIKLKSDTDMSDEWEYSFSVQFTNKRKLEFRHPHGQWAMWAQFVVEDELAHKFGALISDEGVQGHWKPKLHKKKTYSKYTDELNRYFKKKDAVAYKKWKKDVLDRVAPELRGI